jgi:cytochrome c-type biogenesis protein CcsB
VPTDAQLALAHQELALLTWIWRALALATFFYFIHLAARRTWLARLGFAFTAIGAALLTVLIAKHWKAVGHAPYSNLYEYLIAFSWGICIIYLALELITKRTIFGAFVVPLGLAFAMFGSKLPLSLRASVSLMPALKSTWLVIHVGVAVIGYGACAVAFGVGVLYLFRRALFTRNVAAWIGLATLFLGCLGMALLGVNVVKEMAGQSQRVGFYLSAADVFLVLIGVTAFFAILMLLTRTAQNAIPEENTLDYIGYRAIAFAFPFLTLINITGMVWAKVAWQHYWSWDPKETWSAITWFFYLIYLHARLVAGWRGLWAAWFAAAGFVVVLFTFLGVNYLGGLHAYFAP